MREPTQIISNGAAVVVVAGLLSWMMLAPSPLAGPAPGPGSIELSLEVAPEPPKAEPPAAAPQPASPEPKLPEPTPPPPPEPPPPEPPPPPPEPEPEKPAEEPPKPEMLIDEDGEKSKVKEPARQEVSEEVKAKFQGCLAKFMVGLTAKAKKTSERMAVQVAMSFENGKLLALEIVQGSGSPVVDQRARANATNSDCGKVVNTGSLTITMLY